MLQSISDRIIPLQLPPVDIINERCKNDKSAFLFHASNAPEPPADMRLANAMWDRQIGKWSATNFRALLRTDAIC